MPSGYRKDRVSGSVSEPRSTFSRQPATQRYNPALVPNSSSDRNGLILTVPFPCFVADPPYSCSVRIRNGLYRRLIRLYKIRDFTSPVMFYSRGRKCLDLRFRCGSRGIDQLGTLPFLCTYLQELKAVKPQPYWKTLVRRDLIFH